MFITGFGAVKNGSRVDVADDLRLSDRGIALELELAGFDDIGGNGG